MDFEKISPSQNKDKQTSSQEKHPKELREKFNRRKFLIGAGIGALLLAGNEIRKKESAIQQLLKNLKKLWQNNSLKNTGVPSQKKSEKRELPGEEKASPETLPSPELTPMQKLAKDVLLSYYQVFQRENFIPPKVFAKNFLIATQLQESKYHPAAESKTGAVGVMQIMPETIKDTIRCLRIFKKRGIIDFDGPKIRDLTAENIEELKELIKNNADYGRAFGKLYLASLFKIYKIGNKEYRQGNIRSAQKKLLAGYNGGLRTKNLPEKRWRKETKIYCRRIFMYMDYLEKFQKKLKQNNIKSNNDYLSMLLVREMTTYHKIDSRNQLFDDLVNGYISEIKNAEEARQRELTDREIRVIVEKLHNKFTRLYIRGLKKHRANK